MLILAILRFLRDTAAIVVLCVAAAVSYGLIHDQITARICVEYFTIGHPRVIESESPTLLGLAWGVRATWWVGVLLGMPLAFCALLGTRPKQSVRLLVRPVAMLMAVCGGAAILSGAIGFVLARSGLIQLIGPLASQVPADRHVPFLVDRWTHNASYVTGFAGGIILCIRVWRSRSALAASA